MRRRFFVVLGLSGMFIFGACSASIDEKSKAESGRTSQSNGANNGPSAIDQENSNTALLSNGMVIEPQAGDANIGSTTTTDPLQPPNLQGPLGEKMKTMREAKSGAVTVDVRALATKNARPAPDDSTFTSYLTDAGYEIRSFRNHPQLLKAEKRTAGDGSQTLKIFLRNGKVVNLGGEKIPVLSSASAASIAEAAGIPAAQPKLPAPGSTGSKKSAN